ncbi:MAG: B12-binding domain-containing radical SAM protein [Candidatus Abyssubacteria bacterium]|nr:B12-binding domain-containing radical SAM protein [Candidatus Abyssubacteria bacterium]
MNVFMVYVRDDNFYQLLPEKLRSKKPDDGRVKIMSFPPLGIQTLAPIARQHGHQVRMFDTCHPQMKAGDIAVAVREERPDVIVLSCLSTTTYPAVKSIAEQIKMEAPDTPIILGGVFASMNAVHILRDCQYIDCVGVGEGEELLPDYLDNLDNPGLVAGLVWRNGEEIVRNAPRPLIEDLDQFPYPDRTSLPIDYIESLPLDVPAVLSLDKFTTMQTSRGCPHNCIYCNVPAFSNRKWRCRSPEHVLGEMQQLNDMGYRSIYFTDEHFLLKRERIKEICSGIIKRKLEVRWGCEGRVDSIAIDQMPIMREANCFALSFGIEAGTQKVLDRLNKKQSLEQIEHATNEAKRHGIPRTHGFFLIGTPGETEKDILESFRLAARLKLDTFNFNRLCVYRGTPLWKEYVGRGIIDDERDWYKWFKCSDIDPTVLPSDVLNRIRMKGYALLFARRIIGRPIQTIKLVRTFSRNMEMSDIFKLVSAPFRKRKMFHKPDLPARMIDLGIEEPQRNHVPI